MRLILLAAWITFVTSSPNIHSLPCPDHCKCTTSYDGLLRADCSDFAELQKYLRTTKNHSINILNLAHNKITKLNGQLDKLNNLKYLDLSHNEIFHVTKLLRHSKNLTSLNLSYNKLKEFHARAVSRSISSLYLAYNDLENVPDDIASLENIEHLALIGNPLNCNCANLELRDALRQRDVVLSDVICASPDKFKGQSWLQIKTSDFCRKHELNMMDMMMGDQPAEVETIGPESDDGHLLPITDGKVLNEGKVWEDSKNPDDDDDRTFLRVASGTTTNIPETDTIEGSGQEVEDEPFIDDKISEQIMSKSYATDLSEFTEDELLPAKGSSTEDPFEGSGDDGSGMYRSEFITDLSLGEVEDYSEGSGAIELNVTTTTQSFITGMFNPFFIPGNFEGNNTLEQDTFEPPERPNLFQGKIDWDDSESDSIDNDKFKDKNEIVEEVAVRINKHEPEAGLINKDTDMPAPVNGRILLDETLQDTDESKQPKKTSVGTYVCLAILAILLVGLIGFAIVKGQVRKRRDRRLMRQQAKDVEHAGKELIDMNKSLLGKPATTPLEDKRVNGKYELVPTHDVPLNKNTNGSIERPIIENMPKVKNIPQSEKYPTEQGEPSKQPKINDTRAPSQNGKIDNRGSLSSDDVTVPHDDPNKSKGVLNSSPPRMTNGNDPINTDYLSPGREYVPVYSPDMGRVRIKLSETPKPTTPVLVTRTRSNAGDIIITPTIDKRPVTETTS